MKEVLIIGGLFIVFMSLVFGFILNTEITCEEYQKLRLTMEKNESEEVDILFQAAMLDDSVTTSEYWKILKKSEKAIIKTTLKEKK